MPITMFTDESGTHSNRYMVICALITMSDISRKRIKRLMKKELAELQKTEVADEIHASKIDTARKQGILFSLAKKHDYHVAYLVADKNHLVPELKVRSNLCFNYLFNILFKKLVMAYSSDDISIVADNRSVSAGSKNSLPEYIMTEAYAKWGYKGNLTLTFCDSRDVKALQAVDVIANAVYAKYNLEKEHLYNIHLGHYVERIQFPYARFGS